jgi:hypothetical protein
MAGVTLAAGLAGASAALPATAHAGPLLSGYGGPGQGNQAILGSALLGGSAGGSGTSGGGGSRSRGGSSSAAHSRTATHGAAGTLGSKRADALAGERGASSYPAVEPTASRSGPALGLSGADLAYILLAAAALALTGALMRRIARTRTAKGHG